MVDLNAPDQPSATRKSAVAIALGLACVAGTFRTISASFPPHEVTIVWSLFLPMLVALAWGWRYGLVAATVGGAALSPLLLWPSNGYANIGAFLLYGGWLVWHGVFSDCRRRWPSPWNNLYVAQLVYTPLIFGILLGTYPMLFRLNPPFWAPAAATSMSGQVLQTIAIKDSFVLAFHILLCDALLTIGPVRRAFSLPLSSAARLNFRIIAGALLTGAVILGGYIALDATMQGRPALAELAEGMSDEHEKLLLFASLLSLVAGVQLAKYVERRLEVEEALRASEANARTIFDSVNDAIFIHDGESGAILDVNSRACEMYGYEADEFRSLDIGEISLGESPYSQADALQLIVDAMRGEPRLVEWRTKRRDGTLFWSEVNLRRATIGGHERVLVVVRDITERVRAIEGLQESERRYRTLFESATDAVLVVKDDRFVDCNLRTLDVFGCSREAIIGSGPERFSPPLQPDGRDSGAAAAARIEAALAGDSQSFEWMHVRADGSPFDAEVSLTRVDLLSGTYIVATVRDVSERKKLESQLRQSQKMEAIGQLAGGVAHDFNNLLTVITGYAGILAMELQGNADQSELVEQILKAADKSAKLTSQLLAFSRKQAIAPKPADLNELVKGVEKLLLRVIGENIEVRTSLAPGRLLAMVDPVQIEQVMMNLATNARDAMPAGGTFSITTERIDVEETFARLHGLAGAGPYCLVIVSDTGTGMDDEQRQRIFDPFYTTKGVGKGTGLGLSIVYGIVRQHKGGISVYSEPGNGTIFRIFLPLTPDAEVWPEERSDPAPQGHGETILVAEDSEEVRLFVTRLLRKSGYEVIESANGEEAVSAFGANAEHIALVLLDVIMPKKSGREAWEEIRAMKPSVRALFFSGYTADIIERNGLLDEGLELLSKPVAPAELLTRVRTILDR
ncbi:MAG: PAS domain S-box protein [Thermoanaerobaculia bacterium]|jgi:PAS domain S-box-containing protein